MQFLNSQASRSIAFYSLAALCTTLLGKAVVTRFFFDYPLVLLLLQHAASLFIIEVLRITSVVKLAPYSFERGRHLFIPSLLLASLLLRRNYCLSLVVVIGCRPGRWSAGIVLLISGLFLRRLRIDNINSAMVCAICFLSSLAVNFDLALDRFSLFYGAISAFTQAAAFVQLESLSASFSGMDMAYIHSFNSLVFFLLADIVQDEVRDAFMYMMTSANSLFVVLLIILLTGGFFVTITTMHAIAHSNALTVSLASNIRAAIQMMIAYYCGVHLFYDVMPSWVNWIALVGACGILEYAMCASILGTAIGLYKKHVIYNFSMEKRYDQLA